MTTEIKLIQHPVIQHALVETGKSVTERLSALNIENQVATEDTIKTLKSLRAELNNEAKEFEEQRKAVKNSVLSPYDEFEAVYKAEIIEKYKAADTILKDKINAFEMNIKTEKRNNLIAYFNEICAVEKIDWLTFDRLGLDINLSTSEKKYKEEINAFIGKIQDDIALISTETHSAEMLVEFKQSLNASLAIQSVRKRKEAEKLEAERIRHQRTEARKSQIINLRFIWHDLTRTYNWVFDESLMVGFSDIENLPVEEWNKKFVEIESKVNARKKEDMPKKEILQAPVEQQQLPFIQQPEEKEEEVQDVDFEESEQEEVLNAKFIVYGIYKQLILLGEFLKLNNYNYQNIE